MIKKEDLFKAVINGKLEKITSILKKIDVNSINREEQTPLMKAVYKSNLEIVEYLLENGADVNTTDLWKQTALMLSYGLNSDVVKILIEQGADVNAKNHYKRTPLMYFVEYGTVKSMKLLIENNADVNSVDSDNTSALLCSTYIDKDKQAVQKIKLLISKGADINQQNNEGCSALLYASWHLDKSLIQYLIDKGAKINNSNKYGETSLMKAILGANDDVACFLIDRGTNINAVDNNGETAMDIALRRYNNKTILSKLKKLKALKGSDIPDALKPKKKKESEMLIRSSHCPGCGSPKINISKTPYIYCDYCANLIDWDYRIAFKLSSKLSKSKQKKYQEIVNQINEELKKVTQKKNIAEYEKLIKKQTEVYIEYYPGMYTPRIKDKDYKNRYIDFTIKMMISFTFDKELKKIEKEQNAWHKNIQWFESGGKYVAESISFRKLYKIFCKLTKKSNEKFNNSGLFDLYPEKIEKNIWDRIRISEFLQAWIPYLSDEDKEYALSDSGLKGDYHEYKKIISSIRHCGSCGNKLKVPNGAVKTICDNCGRIIDVAAPEINCPSCSSPISFPVEKVQVQCPACDTVVVKAIKPILPY